MQVSNQYRNPIQESFHHKQETQKQAGSTALRVKSAKLPARDRQDRQDHQVARHETDTARQTYGLLILDLMDNPEYKAFERATMGMSEGEKILAAQSLYSLTDFYNGKTQSDKQRNDLFKNTYPPVPNPKFISRYKHALAAQDQIDIRY